MLQEFNVNDLVRIQFIPRHENEALMSKEVHKIFHRIRISTGEIVYFIKTADSGVAKYSAENLRLATKEETLVYKLCQ